MNDIRTYPNERSLLKAWFDWRFEMTPEDGSKVLDLWDTVGQDFKWSIFNGVQRRSDDWDAEFGAETGENPWLDLVITLQDCLEECDI